MKPRKGCQHLVNGASLGLGAENLRSRAVGPQSSTAQLDLILSRHADLRTLTKVQALSARGEVKTLTGKTITLDVEARERVAGLAIVRGLGHH